jgi:hypothetical protein
VQVGDLKQALTNYKAEKEAVHRHNQKMMHIMLMLVLVLIVLVIIGFGGIIFMIHRGCFDFDP